MWDREELTGVGSDPSGSFRMEKENWMEASAPTTEAVEPPVLEEEMEKLRDLPPIEGSDSILVPTKDLFGWQTWIDVPDGGYFEEDGETTVYVPECEAEKAKRGSCDDKQHFHAWVRLPNQFQHRDLMEKASAAKSRRMRMMRDPDTDAYEVIQNEIDELRIAGNKELVVEELLLETSWTDQVQAMADVSEKEEYESIQEDIKRLNELKVEEPRSEAEQDEFEHLVKHVALYHVEVETNRRERQEPQRVALQEKDEDELLTLIKEERIQSAGTETYLHVYGSWQWVLCTMTSDKQRRHFDNVKEVERAPAVVIDAIQGAFNDLETADQGRSVKGNM